MESEIVPATVDAAGAYGVTGTGRNGHRRGSAGMNGRIRAIRIGDERLAAFYETAGAGMDALSVFRRRPGQNRYLFLRGDNGGPPGLAFYHATTGLVHVVDDQRRVSGIFPRNTEQVFAIDALTRREIGAVVLTGKWGSGKTLLAAATALEWIQQHRDADVHFLAPPRLLGNAQMGFFPGSPEKKSFPYSGGVWDALALLQKLTAGKTKGNRTSSVAGNILSNREHHVIPWMAIQGRTFHHSLVIADEGQNATVEEMTELIARMGVGSKLVVLGDIAKSALPDSIENGLVRMIRKLSGDRLFVHVNLKRCERSELAALADKMRD